MRKGLKVGVAALLGVAAAVSVVDAGARAATMPSLTGCGPSGVRSLSSLSSAELSEAATGSTLSEDKLRTLSRDKSASIDACGGLVYVDPPATEAPRVRTLGRGVGALASEPLAPVAPLAETFTLESLPGSNHTIYLNFKG